MQINYQNPAFKEDFRKFLISRGISENTAKNHISQATLFLEKVNGKLDMLKEILSQEILEFFNSKKVYSVRYSLRFLFSFIDLKTEFKTSFSKIYEEIIREHKRIFRQKEREAKRKWLTKEEFKEILNNLPPNYKLFFQMQYETACRSGALVNLRVQDIMKREGDIVTITLREKGNKISTFTLSYTLSQLLLLKIQGKPPLARVFEFKYSAINNILMTLLLKC
jgi:Phage integrase family.